MAEGNEDHDACGITEEILGMRVEWHPSQSRSSAAVVLSFDFLFCFQVLIDTVRMHENIIAWQTCALFEGLGTKSDRVKLLKNLCNL